MMTIHSFLLVMAMLLLGVCRAHLFYHPHLEVRCCVFRDQIHIPLTLPFERTSVTSSTDRSRFSCLHAPFLHSIYLRLH